MGILEQFITIILLLVTLGISIYSILVLRKHQNDTKEIKEEDPKSGVELLFKS